jgi:hypothetical protein
MYLGRLPQADLLHRNLLLQCQAALASITGHQSLLDLSMGVSVAGLQDGGTLLHGFALPVCFHML